ncbi:MAG: hypothetical protein ABW167_19575 [Baekduia sp.]
MTKLPGKTADDDLDPGDKEAIDGVNGSKDSDDLGDAGGKSLEEIAAEGEEDAGQQFLDFGDTLNLAFKGKKPTESQLKIKAISREVKGQLGDKGDDEIYTFIVRGRLDEDQIVRRRDGDGKVTTKIRRAVLTPISMTLVEEAQLAEVLG